MSGRALLGGPLLAGLALAAPPAAAQPTACALNAIVFHRVGGPTLLRTAPRIRARARAAIPFRNGGLVAQIRAADSGWFRVAAVRTPTGRLAIKANGWLHGSRLVLKLRSIGGKGVPLHEDPSPRARVDIRLNADVAKRSLGVLLDCNGRWARVRIGRVIGWLPPQNQCAIPRRRCQ